MSNGVWAKITCTSALVFSLLATCLSAQERAVLKDHRDGPFCLSFSPDSKLLAVAVGDGVKIWDVANAKCLQDLEIGRNFVGRGGHGANRTRQWRVNNLAAEGGF